MAAAKKIALLMEIAERALDADDCERARKIEAGRLKAAYRLWKAKNSVARVERDTPEWDRMLEATDPEHCFLEDAKRRERNARKRLSTAVRRYRAA